MTAIATVTGKVIDFLNPDPEQLSLDDIARGLSRAPRYAGQTDKPYTVIQHSLLVAHLVPAEHRLHALLHDAPEAYLCDVPSPAKEAMRQITIGAVSPYDILEDKLWQAMAARWDLSPMMPEIVKQADFAAMVIEAPALQPKGWDLPIWSGARGEPNPLVNPGSIYRFYQLLLKSTEELEDLFRAHVESELAFRCRAA